MTWLYMFAVTEMLECPSRSCMTLCRRSCRRMTGSPAWRASWAKCFETVSGCQALPSARVKTRSVSIPRSGEFCGLVSLPGLDVPEDFHGHVVKGHCALPVRRLGLAQLHLVGDGDHRLPDGEQAGVEVDR